MKLTTTLLLPTLNEIEAARVIIPQIRREWVDEIIVVDGGSTDGTVEFMRDAGLRVHSQTSRGYGEGLLEAIHLASGDVIIEFNPDGNSIPADIPRIVAKINEGYDLVIGSRYREGAKSDDDDWLTATGNWMFTAIVNLLFRTQYTDSLVGFRAYRREQALRLDLDAPGLSWPCQTSTRFARAGLRVTEIFAHEPARIGGKRKMMPFRTGLQITKLILRDFLTFHPKPVPGKADRAAGAETMSAAATISNPGQRRPFKLLQRCKVCGSGALTDVISIAPQFLSPTFTRDNAEEGELAKIRVPLTMTLCDRARNPDGCGLLQLREEVDADLLYRRYFYRSATSETMRNDLRDVVEDISSRLDLKPQDIVVDIGANDCTTLAFYPDHLRRVGFEPARNIDWSHVDRSITVINDYFSAKPFEQRFPGAKAKAVGCNAMFYDLSDPNSFVADVKAILAPDGLWCIQLSYLPLMLTNMNFYDICHEHLSYYSLDALKKLMERNGLAVVDASTNAVNGGSLRAFVTHAGQQARRHRSGTAQSRRARRHGARAEIGSGADLSRLFQQNPGPCRARQQIPGAGNPGRRKGLRAWRLHQGQRIAAVLRHHQGADALYQRAQSGQSWPAHARHRFRAYLGSNGLATFAPAPWWFCRGTSKRKSWTASRIICGKAASCCFRCPMRTW